MAAWGVEVGIIIVRDFIASKRPPLPSELLATFIVFGTLSVIAGNATARRPATAVAWGLVVATAVAKAGEEGVGPVKPGTGLGDAFGKVGDFLAGSAGVGPTSPTVVGAAPSARPVTNQGGSLLNAQKGL